MKRNEKIFVLYDEDEEYSRLMCEYLMGCKNLPWKIVGCTSRRDLDLLCESITPEVILSAASVYEESIAQKSNVRPIILNDGEDIRGMSVVEKYQPADETLKGILKIYSGCISDDSVPELLPEGNKAMLIGVFSPIRRCYQTTFSVLMGRLLSERGKVLYLSFEFCEGFDELSDGDGSGNLSDLVYFINSPQPVFSMRFRSMVRNIAGLDYIPCAVSGTDIAEIPEDEWKAFLTRICVLEKYSYVILDLSESVRGIFEVLRMCDKIFTLTGNDRTAKKKIESYENVLNMYDYSDVAEKSIKFHVPSVKRVPSFSGEVKNGELVDFISDQIRGTI